MDDTLMLDIVMQQALENNNERIIDQMFEDTASFATIETVEKYCHYDYTKKSTECVICMEKRLSHKCLQCEYSVCTICFININRNRMSSKCPSCRFQYDDAILASKTTENMQKLCEKYSDLPNIILPNSTFDRKKLEDCDICFTSQYNFRDNRLEISSVRENADATSTIKSLQLNLNIINYNVPIQQKIINKMHNIWDKKEDTTKSWNSLARVIINKLRNKAPQEEISTLLDNHAT